MTERLGLAEFFLAAEYVTGVDAQQLLRTTDVGLAESALSAPHASFGGVDFHPDDAERAGILCSRIVKNHPLHDGNKRTGLMLMLEYLARRGLSLRMPAGGNDEVADHIERLAAGTLSEVEFVAWVRALVERPSHGRR